MYQNVYIFLSHIWGSTSRQYICCWKLYQCK